MPRSKRKWIFMPPDLEEEIAAYATKDKIAFTEVTRDLLREALAVRREKGPTGKLIIEGNGKRREIVVV